MKRLPGTLSVRRLEFGSSYRYGRMLGAVKEGAVRCQNPLVKRDLVDAILELRADVEKQLQANKYYVALNKLDELLAAIRPLEIEGTAVPVETPRQEAEPAPRGRARERFRPDLVRHRPGIGDRRRRG